MNVNVWLLCSRNNKESKKTKKVQEMQMEVLEGCQGMMLSKMKRRRSSHLILRSLMSVSTLADFHKRTATDSLLRFPGSDLAALGGYATGKNC